MKRISVIGVETLRGLGTVELVEADITEIESDLLVVSAFRGDFLPTPGTLLGALHHRYGIDLRDEIRRTRLDLREQFGLVVTNALAHTPARRVLVLEMAPLLTMEPDAVHALIDEATGNLGVGLAMLEAKGLGPRKMVLPLLGAGSQGLDPMVVLPLLLARMREAIARSATLEEVWFVEIDPQRCELLRQAIGEAFGALPADSPRRQLIEALSCDIASTATCLIPLTSGLQKAMARELHEAVAGGAPATATIGLLARRMAEMVTDHLLNGARDIDLYRKIERLAQMRVSPWMVNYLHTLRVIGNEVVHIRDSGNRQPPSLGEADMVMCLFCIQRVAEFWLDGARSPR